MHTVLVVEDDTMVRMPIAEYLRGCGYTVLEAGSASEAISALDSDAPVSLVFSDIRMPGEMDGVGLAEWCHAHRPALPVLLTSAYSGGRNPRTAPFPGNGFVVKPYSQSQVERQIAGLLGGRSRDC
jgi:CheY-like chemotaxis protein